MCSMCSVLKPKLFPRITRIHFVNTFCKYILFYLGHTILFKLLQKGMLFQVFKKIGKTFRSEENSIISIYSITVYTVLSFENTENLS